MRKSEGIYVIYRPLPATLITLVLAAIGAFGGLLLGSAVGAALGQRDPGTGVWDLSATETISGMIVAEPYPMLLPDDGSAGIILVGVGKVGPPDDVTSIVGMNASVTGYPLERHGMRMLEVQSAERMDGASNAPHPVARALGDYEITGEILDSKCYLGAMKPGDGLGHRACANLCIRGGIPPMLWWQDEDGVDRYALVIGPDGQPMPKRYLETVGMNAVLRGKMQARDGWLWFQPSSGQ